MNYLFKVKGKNFDSEKQIINGQEILEIAGYTPVDEYQLYLEVEKNVFEPIQLTEKVDLSNPGVEHFIVQKVREVHIFVNGDKYDFTKSYLSPREIVDEVEEEPQNYYLKQIIGHKEINYKNDMDNPIQIRNGLKFITALLGAATVS